KGLVEERGLRARAPEALETMPGGLEDFTVLVDADDARLGRPRKTLRRERARARPEVDDRPRVGRYDRGRGREHRLVVRNEGADPRVVVREIDAEMCRNAHHRRRV